MDPVSAVIMAGLVGGLLAWAVRADLRRKRAQPDSSVVNVADAKAGTFVRIVGTVVEGTTTLAPITGRACVCFSSAATGIELVSNGRGEPWRRWHPVTSRVGANGFVLEDRTGRIAVDPRGAIVRLDLDHHVTMRRGDSPPIHDTGFLPATAGQHDEIILDEGVVPIGARVVVEAMVQQAGGGPDDAAYRRSGGELVLAGGAKRSPSISDLPANIEQALADARAPKR